MSYRDDRDPLSERREALRRELADVEQQLRERGLARRLPVLGDVRIASPCDADWAGMVGDERVRHCTSCNRNVYNLSAMTHYEAEELVRTSEGRMCVRYYQRADGTILTADCPVGAGRKRRRRMLTALAAASLAGLGAAAMSLTTRMGAPVSRPPAVETPDHLSEGGDDQADQRDFAKPPPPRPRPTPTTPPLQGKLVMRTAEEPPGNK